MDHRYILNRVTARQERKRRFSYLCPVHGETDFSVSTGGCISCQPRGARAAARRAGQDRYVSVCPVHGETEYSTLRGLCLTCYNTAGKPRAVHGDPDPESVYVIDVDQVVTPSGAAMRAGTWRRRFGRVEFYHLPVANYMDFKVGVTGLQGDAMFVPVDSPAGALMLKSRDYGPLAVNYVVYAPDRGAGNLFHGSDGKTYLATDEGAR